MYGLTCLVLTGCLLSGAASHPQWLTSRQAPEISIVVFSPGLTTSYVPENSALGTVLALVTVNAEGDDDDTVACSAYSEHDVAALQEVHRATYKLILTAQLDRELIPSHDVHLTCIDFEGERSSAAELTLDVEDVNDNIPVFPRPSFLFSVSRSASVGAAVGRVRAFDRDAGENADIRYSLLLSAGEPGDDLPLAVDAESGRLTTARSLERDVVQEVFIVTARDMGVPPLTASASVTLVIKDN